MTRTIPQPKTVNNQSPIDSQITMALLVGSGIAGTYSTFNFLDASIHYFGVSMKQTFQYTLIDNIGTGEIRVCYNKPEYTLTNPIIGSKTLSSKDSMYIEEDVFSIRVYYITASTVELVLKSDFTLGGR